MAVFNKEQAEGAPHKSHPRHWLYGGEIRKNEKKVRKSLDLRQKRRRSCQLKQTRPLGEGGGKQREKIKERR